MPHLWTTDDYRTALHHLIGRLRDQHAELTNRPYDPLYQGRAAGLYEASSEIADVLKAASEGGPVDPPRSIQDKRDLGLLPPYTPSSP